MRHIRDENATLKRGLAELMVKISPASNTQDNRMQSSDLGNNVKFSKADLLVGQAQAQGSNIDQLQEMQSSGSTFLGNNADFSMARTGLLVDLAQAQERDIYHLQEIARLKAFKNRAILMQSARFLF